MLEFFKIARKNKIKWNRSTSQVRSSGIDSFSFYGLEFQNQMNRKNKNLTDVFIPSKAFRISFSPTLSNHQIIMVLLHLLIKRFVFDGNRVRLNDFIIWYLVFLHEII